MKKKNMSVASKKGLNILYLKVQYQLIAKYPSQTLL